MKELLAAVMMVCLFAEVSLGDFWQDLAKYQYGDGPNLNEEQRVEMFRNAAVLAKRVEEKKLIAGHLNKAPSALALGLANTYLDDPALMKEGEQSALDIAERLHGANKGPDDLIKNNSNVERAKALLN